MKQLIVSFFILLFCLNGFSQARVTVTDYQKIQEPAIEHDLPFPEKTVINAIQDKLEKMGYKGKESKDFMVFKGVRLPELGSDLYDLYFRTDRRNKKEKDNSIVILMISKGPGSFVSEATDTTLVNNAKKYLENLTPIIMAYDLEQQIADQTEVLKKADKKMSSLVEDGEELAKKKKKIDEQIADNLKSREAQKAEMDKQKQFLDTLISKRKQ